MPIDDLGVSKVKARLATAIKEEEQAPTRDEIGRKAAEAIDRAVAMMEKMTEPVTLVPATPAEIDASRREFEARQRAELRDRFAMAALSASGGIRAMRDATMPVEEAAEWLASDCYTIADAMLAARDRKVTP